MDQNARRGPLGGADEQYRLLMEAVTDQAIFLLDPAGRVAAWNAGARRLFGYEEAEVLGRGFDLFFTPQDRERGEPDKELRTVAQEGGAINDRWHVRKDGTRLWVSGTTTALRDENGGLRGFANVSQDRTEQRRAEEALREADRRKDVFLAILAHELRNPLAPIRNAVEFLRLREPAEPDLKEARDIIERQVRHLTRLVDDLLDVTRITRGKVVLHKQPVEVATAVADAVETCRPLIDERGQELNVVLTPALRVEADPTRLAQVVGNLLNNAAKYTPEGGHIRLSADREGGEVVLRVKDDGIGIPPAVLPHVFDLFAQAEGSLHRSQGGLGIGLTLVRSLVEMHGGRVGAFSEGPGKGSEFVTRFPLLSGSPAEVAPEDPQEGGAPSSPRRVLVVDDNTDAANSMAMLLRQEGHEARAVHEGPAVLGAARDFRPDVVLLDIGLPGGLTGYDLAPRLRELPGLEKVLLVALTGYGQEEDKRCARDAGFDAHLTKPADLAALHALLAKGRRDG
jgi:PAS domain S-box-containing protein